MIEQEKRVSVERKLGEAAKRDEEEEYEDEGYEEEADEAEEYQQEGGRKEDEGAKEREGRESAQLLEMMNVLAEEEAGEHSPDEYDP
jgi:hypothetical protein